MEYFQEFFLSSPNEMYREYVLKKHLNQYSCGKMYRSKIFDNIRFPVGRYYEDVPVGFRVIGESKGIAGLACPGYAYRRFRTGSITRRIDDRILDLNLNMQDLMTEYGETKPELIPYINTMQVMHLRVNMVSAWRDKEKREYWLEKFMPFIKEARQHPYIWGSRTECIHWALFLKMPRLYLNFWDYYQSRKK